MKQRRAYTNLAHYLEASGTSQADLARQLKTTQATVSHIINGLAKPSLRLAIRIAKATNIPIESLDVDTESVTEASGCDHA